MSEKETGGPAFPYVIEQPTRHNEIHEGMTLRDWFAGKWLQGFVSNSSTNDMAADQAAAYAYRVADAMLKERSK